MKGGSFHTRRFRRIHFSVFRYGWSKNGFTGPKSFRGFRETGPWFETWSGTLCCVHGARRLNLTVPLSTQEYKWVPENCWGNLTNCGDVTCDGLASRPGGVEILLAASCYGNRDKLRQHEPDLASRLHFFFCFHSFYVRFVRIFLIYDVFTKYQYLGKVSPLKLIKVYVKILGSILCSFCYKQ